MQVMQWLVGAVQELSLARRLETIMEIMRVAARELTGADGATFVLRDQDQCFYADEDAIAPLWKGQRFPMKICLGGWVGFTQLLQVPMAVVVCPAATVVMSLEQCCRSRYLRQ